MVGKMITPRKLLCATFVAAALCASGTTVAAQKSSAVVRGQEVAERFCAGCHATNDQKERIVQGTIVPSFRALAGRPNLTPQRLQAFIMTPHRPMPGMSLELAEVDDLVAYILSLR